jgi:hypothetical protein
MTEPVHELKPGATLAHEQGGGKPLSGQVLARLSVPGNFANSSSRTF